MATGFTYTWQDAINLVSGLLKGTPTTALDAQTCDMVSSEMYRFWPWYYTLTSATLVASLTNGVQDYTSAVSIYRLTDARMVRTDNTPNQNIELTVKQTIPPDLVPRSYTAITDISNEAGVGKLRLSSAVSVASGVTLRIDGRYQPFPTKVADLSQSLWFPDEYISVAAEGILYWYYKLSDDPRAGGKATNDSGKIIYSGQYANFNAALQEMSRAEDFPATDQMFPDEPMGLGRGYYGTLNIYGSN